MSLLGIDVGTSGCKAMVLGVDGRLGPCAIRRYATRHPAPGRAELDSRLVWDGVREAIREAAAAWLADPITAVSVSSMGEAVVPLSKGGAILGESILGADLRGECHMRELGERFPEAMFYDLTANIPMPNCTLPQFRWMREKEPTRLREADYFLSWADAVAFLLGAQAHASSSLASRTQLYDPRAHAWCEPLTAWAGIDPAKLGRPVHGGAEVGRLSDAMAAELVLPRGAVLIAGGHDQCLNSLGSGCAAPGHAVCGIGSFECFTPTFPAQIPRALLKGLRMSVEPHVLEGRAVTVIYNQAGTLIQWFLRTFAAKEAGELGNAVHGMLEGEIPEAIGEVIALPFFERSGAPEFRHTSGVLCGMSPATTRGEILKAIMEGATFYFHEQAKALSALGLESETFIATGGGSRSDAWLQIKADIMGRPFARLNTSEGSVLGAAMLAGIGTGVFASAEEAASRVLRRERSFEPRAAEHAQYQEKFARYRAVLKALGPVLDR